MAFPTTPILDDFNRADEGPPPSANWTAKWLNNDTGTGLQVVSNTVFAPGGGNNSDWWNPATYGPDCEGYCTSVTLVANRLGLRLTTPSGVLTTDGYGIRSTTTTFQFSRLDDGAVTTLGATETTSAANGDAFGASMEGPLLSGYSRISGVWGLVSTRTDSTYTAAGYLGIAGGSGTWRGDDFGGGTIVKDYTVINGTQSQLVNVNAAGVDVDALTYKATVSLTGTEAAALASTAGVFLTADATPQQLRLIIKRVIRNAST